MKYIRTQEGRILKGNANRVDTDVFEIVKVADTIEELVDKYLRVFVGKDKEMTPYLMYSKNDNYFSKNETVVYACIWVKLPNGAYRLEPVAKLNEKGELKLL